MQQGVLREEYPLYLGGKAVRNTNQISVLDKYSGKVATHVSAASEEDIEKAIAQASDAAGACAKMTSWQKKAVLLHVIAGVTSRFEEFAQVLCIEAGKTIREARGEVTRLLDTFTVASEECTRQHGEYLSLDISERAAGCSGIVKRFPVGVVSLISPFNFPLNLVAHKVAPAIVAGCPFILKPASRTPVGALLLGEILSQTDLPAGAFSVLPCTRAGADRLTTDPRIKLISFTGSTKAGWLIKERAGKKKVVLELGGNAGCVVEDVADIASVVQRIAFGAFYQSGQSCISVQRVFVHSVLYEEFKQRLSVAAEALIRGDPADPNTSLGPMIAEAEAKRVESWVEEAVSRGGRIVTGGHRHGAFFEATVLEDVPVDCQVVCEEVFGPVLVLARYSAFEEAIKSVNDSRYGLQAGVFTADLNKAFFAFHHLEVGGVVINDVPSLRVDSQPYGGVKDSGLGREGIRYSVEDMTEPRIMLFKNAGVL